MGIRITLIYLISFILFQKETFCQNNSNSDKVRAEYFLWPFVEPQNGYSGSYKVKYKYFTNSDSLYFFDSTSETSSNLIAKSNTSLHEFNENKAYTRIVGNNKDTIVVINSDFRSILKERSKLKTLDTITIYDYVGMAFDIDKGDTIPDIIENYNFKSNKWKSMFENICQTYKDNLESTLIIYGCASSIHSQSTDIASPYNIMLAKKRTVAGALFFIEKYNELVANGSNLDLTVKLTESGEILIVGNDSLRISVRSWGIGTRFVANTDPNNYIPNQSIWWIIEPNE